MKFITTLFSSGLIISCNVALAMEAGTASGVDPSNPFSGVLDFGPFGMRIVVSGEDLSNPFIEAHPIEQDRYKSLYYIHYHAQFYTVNDPAPEKMPSAFDAQGFPLWFDGSYGDTALQNLVVGLLGRGQFDDVDHLFDDWNNPSERTADGRWKLTRFQHTMDNITTWDSAYQHIRRWREKTPKSRAAALTEALYWLNYAWNARGEYSAESVTHDGWKLFRERLEKAEAVLLESKEYASSSPLWWNNYLRVGAGLEWPKERLLEIFREATKKEKYFYPIYTVMANSLGPKWGGSWQIVDMFIKDAVKNTKKVEGHSMYARLYWRISALESVEFNLFRDSLATWPEMKRGFEDIVRRYPHSAWNINNFAASACIAGDKEAFQSLRYRIGKTITREAWPSNYSMDLCEHKFETPL